VVIIPFSVFVAFTPCPDFWYPPLKADTYFPQRLLKAAAEVPV